MTGSANALQAAIYQRLAEDPDLLAMIGPGSVFDRRMTGRPMPYLVLGGIVTSDFGPDAEEHLVTIEAWSDAEGRRQVQAIAARVKQLLDDAPLALSGVSLVGLLFRTMRARREPGTRAQMVEMRFRAVTEG
ncbi:MAG: DUF3168 domain-containing protein [Rhizobiaceae bacterium]|nr:DUF3168 domain-containing protein [Rhizobiaceae bacterium]